MSTAVTTRSRSGFTMGGQIELKDLATKLTEISERIIHIDETTRENKKLLDEQNNIIATLIKRCDYLEQDNAKKDEVIHNLSNKVEALEQYSRIDNIVISGLETRLYSSTVRSDNTDTVSKFEEPVLENSVLELLNDELHANIKPSDISVMHYLPRKIAAKAKPNVAKQKDIIVRFTNRKAKNAVMAKKSNLKKRKEEGKPRIFISDHLTKSNSELFYQSRELRRKKMINNTWTYNCKVFIRTNGNTPEEHRVIPITNIADLEQFHK